MKKQIKLLLICSIIFAGTSSYAAENDDFYFGVGLGSSKFKLNNPSIIASYTELDNTSTVSNSSTAISFFSGMRLDEYLSLEMDILLAGDITATSGAQTIKLFNVGGLSLTAMLSTKVSDHITLFGRFGAVFWDISKATDDAESINNAIDLTYGAGADINLYGSSNRQLRLQWNHFQYDGVFINSNDTLTASLLFQFSSN